MKNKKIYNGGFSEIAVIAVIVGTVVVLSVGFYSLLGYFKDQSLRNRQIATQISDYGFQYVVRDCNVETIKSIDSVSAEPIGYPGGWCMIRVSRKQLVDTVVLKVSSVGHYRGVKQIQKKELAIPLGNSVE